MVKFEPDPVGNEQMACVWDQMNDTQVAPPTVMVPVVGPKLVPVMVIEVPPCVGPVRGETLVIVGELYENKYKLLAELRTLDTMMVTFNFEPEPAGTVHAIWVDVQLLPEAQVHCVVPMYTLPALAV